MVETGIPSITTTGALVHTGTDARFDGSRVGIHGIHFGVLDGGEVNMIVGDILADSARLNSYTGAELLGKGFNGCIPYIGIGGGRSLPNKRLTAYRYNDYSGVGLEVPAFFVELGTADADGGFDAGVFNAQRALEDLVSMRIFGDDFVVVAVNDKTSWSMADIDYVDGFQLVFGRQTGVYGFADFLRYVYDAVPGIQYFHQCGLSPIKTGTHHFVNVWQDNTYNIDGIDVNHVLEVPTMTDILDETIEREGRTSITLRQYVAAADDVTDQTRTVAHADVETILAAIASIPPVQVSLSDAQVALLATSIVDAVLKRMGGQQG